MKPKKSLLLIVGLSVMLLAATTARAQSSNGDRVYTGDQTSNTVSVIDPAPHEGFFTPNGRELWVVVRGEDYVSVIDPMKMKEVRRIKTANGPVIAL